MSNTWDPWSEWERQIRGYPPQGALGSGATSGGMGGWAPPSSRTGGMPSPVAIMPGGTGGASSGFMPSGAPLRGRSMGGAAAGGASGPFAMPGPVQPGAQAAATGGRIAPAAGFLAGAGATASAPNFLQRVIGPGGGGFKGFLARAGRGAGIVGLGGVASGLIPQVAGTSIDDRFANALGYGSAGFGLGMMTGPAAPVLAPVLGGAGVLAGALGFDPFGLRNSPTEAAGEVPTMDEMQGTYERLLTGQGADQDYINRAWAGFKHSLELNPGLDEAGQAELARQVLQTALSQLGIEQERQFYESNMAAVQAWMEPLMREQLDRSQWYADNYAQAGQAAASEIHNPALRAALMAQGDAYSSQQASSNALALQQMAHYPEAFLGEVADAYESQLMALQQQIDMGVAGGGYMQAPIPTSITGPGPMGGADAPILLQGEGGAMQGTYPPWTNTSPMPGNPGAPGVPGMSSAPTGTTTTMPGAMPPTPTSAPMSEGAPWTALATVPPFIMTMGPVAAQTWLERHGHTLAPEELQAAQAWLAAQRPTVTQPPASTMPGGPPTGTLPSFYANAGG